MELAKAYVQIVPSANGIQGSISEVLGSEADRAGNEAGTSIASKIKNAIVAAGIGTAITSVIKSAISEGGELEQSIGGIETLFKSSSDQMKEYASTAYERAGISANKYMQQSTSFAASLISSLHGDTAKAAKYADRAITDMADNSNKMGTALQDIQNAYQGFSKQNYTMLDNLKLGYGGTKEEMLRLIKDSSKMKDVQKELNLTVKDGDLSFGNIVNAISVMQKHLGITGTTADEAAKTLEGSFNSMKAAAQDLLGNWALGNDIKPQLENLIKTTTTYLQGNLWKAIKNVFKGFPEIISTFGNVGFQFGMEFITNISKGLSGNVTTFISNALPMIAQFSATLRSNAGQLIDAGLNLLVQLAQGIANGIPALIENIPQIVTNIAGIINDNAPQILATGVQIIVTLAKGIIDSIPVLIANIGSIGEAIFSVWNAINWWNLGKNLISGIKDGIANIFESLKTGVTEKFSSIKTAIENVFKSIFDSASNIWGSVKNAIVNFVEQIFTNVSLIFNNMKTGVSGIFNGIKSIASTVWSGIKSIIHTIASGIKLSVEGVFNGIKSSISSVFNGIKSITSTVWNAIKTAITSPLTTAKNTVKSIIDAIKGFFNFKISWPHIPLPHFSVSPKGWGIGDLLKGKIPSLGIKWYAKAMNDPMMLDGATIFGATNGSLLGGGETGREYITGETGLAKVVANVLDSRLENVVNKQMTLLELIIEILKAILDKDPNIVLDDGTLIGKIIDKIDEELYRRKLAGARGL
nr:MAG TPA: tail tape measure protein [Caudoviricetes sp.]